MTSRLYRRAAILTATAVTVVTAAACSHAQQPAPASGSTQAAASAPASAVPDTAAAVKSAARQFFALYSAGQWAAAWQFLAPAEQKAAPLGIYEAYHARCKSPAAGMAYVIKSITMAGKTAVITYTLAGAAGALGAATVPVKLTPAGWKLAPSEMIGEFSHGSTRADVAAAKAKGDCA